MKEAPKKIIRIVIALILIGLTGYYTVRNVDLVAFWKIIRGADYLWVLLSIPVSLFSHWIRAMRWKTMLEPIKKNGSVWNMFSAVMVGYAMNNVLPRGGEFAHTSLRVRPEGENSIFCSLRDYHCRAIHRPAHTDAAFCRSLLLLPRSIDAGAAEYALSQRYWCLSCS